MMQRLNFVLKADDQFGKRAVDPQTAERYLEVVSCLPRLAPRRAIDVCGRAAGTRLEMEHGLRCFLPRSRRGRAERLGTSNPTKTRPPDRALLAVLAPLLAAADMRLPCRDS